MSVRQFQSPTGSVATITFDPAANETRISVDGNEIYTGGGDRVDEQAAQYINQGWQET